MREILSELRDYFLRNIGQVVDAAELQVVSGGIGDWARLIDELREVEGYPVLTHRDRDDLLPGQYLLASERPLPVFDPAVPAALRAYVLGWAGLACEMCGAEGGEVDTYGPARRVRLHVDARPCGAAGDAGMAIGLRVRCSVCAEGMGESVDGSADMAALLARLQRARGSEQLAALAWLLGRFPERARFLLGARGAG